MDNVLKDIEYLNFQSAFEKEPSVVVVDSPNERIESSHSVRIEAAEANLEIAQENISRFSFQSIQYDNWSEVLPKLELMHQGQIDSLSPVMSVPSEKKYCHELEISKEFCPVCGSLEFRHVKKLNELNSWRMNMMSRFRA